MNRIEQSLGLVALSTIIIFIFSSGSASAQVDGDIVSCSTPYNVSNSEGYASADPLLISDPAGVVHLFWAERVTGDPGAIPNVPDTMMYAVWNGETWSEPVDIFISPSDHFNQRIMGMQGVVDLFGMIHLVWLGPDNTLYYSSANAADAGSANSWSAPVLLADDQTGTQFSVDIAYQSPDILHLVYAKSPEGDTRTVTYVRSENLGADWTEPIDIYNASDPGRGASNIQVLSNEPEKVYVTWTEWDETGNGQAVYFVKSESSGLSWDEPVILDVREGEEYERDWANLAVLDEDELVVLWEGGFRAYPQTQYSLDDGETWSEPVDTFYWLIADNGFGQFVRDSENQLHVFLIRRVREGFEGKCATIPGCSELEYTNALWHSVWEGGTKWREPKPLAWVNDNYTSVATNLGNQLIAASFGVIEQDVTAIVCDIQGAPAVAPVLRSIPPPLPTSEPTPNLDLATPSPAADPTANSFPTSTSSDNDDVSLIQRLNSPISLVAIALIPSTIILLLIILVRQYKIRTL